MQLSLDKHPDLPNVPLVMDFAKTDEQQRILRLIFARQAMGRPYLAPPGVPKDRTDALRAAFDATMKDPDFLADAAKAQLEVTPVSGEDVEKLVQRNLSDAEGGRRQGGGVYPALGKAAAGDHRAMSRWPDGGRRDGYSAMIWRGTAS